MIILGKVRKGLFCAAVLIFFSCSEQAVEPGAASRFVIENDQELLNSRLIVLDEELPLNKSGVSKSVMGNLTFKRRGIVAPPEIDGTPLHASHVTLEDGIAYVSYHTRDNQYQGAAEIINVRDVRKPFIKSQILFEDTDITIASRYKTNVYLGQATNPDGNDGFNSPAALEVIHLNEDGDFSKSIQRIDLPSFNTNDILFLNDLAYITSGSSGGMLSIYDLENEQLITQLEVNNAKAVKCTPDFVVAMAGTGERLHIFRHDNNELDRTVELGCENFLESKAELATLNDMVYASAASCGLLAYDIAGDSLLKNIDLGDYATCNSVSVSKEYNVLLLARGADGLQVAVIDPTGLESVGVLDLQGSTNFVAVEGNMMFVANGEGGLQIIEVTDL